MLTLGLSGFMFPAGSAACRIKENTPPPHAFLSGQAAGLAPLGAAAGLQLVAIFASTTGIDRGHNSQELL
jgi:hypothetical protein